MVFVANTASVRYRAIELLLRRMANRSVFAANL